MGTARDGIVARDDARDVPGAREAAAGAASAFKEFLDWCGASIAERVSEVIPPGATVLTLSASSTVRRSLEDLARRYPALRDRIKGIAVSIDGTIYRDDWEQPIPEGAEVGLLVRIAGG